MIENMLAPAVEVERLRKTYGDKVAVEDVSFRVEPGEVFGILGPNGAGKTTTVESVCGLRVGDAGRVRVHGIDPWTDRDATTRIVGVQLQESRLQPKITVREALEMWAAFYDDPLPWSEPAERLGLADHLDKRFGTLSGGQQQRLSIACALVGDQPSWCSSTSRLAALDPQGAPQPLGHSCASINAEGRTHGQAGPRITWRRPRRSATGSPSWTPEACAPSVPRPS